MHADPWVIRVGFDQPVRATSILCDGLAEKCPNRERLGLPTASYVVMFPGFLVQLDKHSLLAWGQCSGPNSRTSKRLPCRCWWRSLLNVTALLQSAVYCCLSGKVMRSTLLA